MRPVFTSFFWCADKIVLQVKKQQLYEQIIQRLVKTGKLTEINKQFYVKFWLLWMKYKAVSLLSCTWFQYTFKFIISTKRSITLVSNCALITTQTFCSAPSALALLCIAFIPTVFTIMFQRCYRLGGWECHNFIFKNFNSEKFRN